MTDSIGVYGNDHEFAFGLGRTLDDTLYISLNTTSKFAGVWDILRGGSVREKRPGCRYSAGPYEDRDTGSPVSADS